MNFLCENCKQKYHVADEKLRGREVTKFKCKKCGHIIEVRGAVVGSGDDAEPASASILSSIPPANASESVAPKPAPSSLGAAKPAGGALPTAAPKSTVTTAPKPTGSPAGANKPLGSSLPTTASTKSAGAATVPAASAPKSAAGALPTTVPRSTASAAARMTSPATSSPSPAALTARKPAATVPASTPAAQPSALRSSITQPSSSAQDSTGPRPSTVSASTSALLNPSETGWYAGIREVPVGPLTRADLAAKFEAGEINADTLVWREGLDDWRPLSSVHELSDLLREASKRMSVTMLGTQSSKSIPSNVIPLSRANTARDFDEPEEATRLTSLSDLIATAEGSSTPKKPDAKSEPPATEPKAPAHEFKTEPKESTPAAQDDLLDDPFFKGPSKKPTATPAATMTPAVTAGMATPTPAAPEETFGQAANTPSIESVAPPKQEEKKGGVPVGVVVMMGGLLVLVGGGGLYAGTRIHQQQPAVQQPTPPLTQQPVQPAQPARLDPLVGAQINLNEQPAQPAQSAQSTAPSATVVSHSPTTRSASGTSHPGSSGSAARTSSGTTTGLTAEQLRQMQAQLNGAMPPGIANANAGGPVGNAARSVSSSSNSESVTGPTGSARAGQVLETFRRTNVVGSCWQQQITRNPAHPAERINVTLTVNSTGRATNVTVQGANDPALAACIQSRARAQNYGPGGPIDAQASFNLQIGN